MIIVIIGTYQKSCHRKRSQFVMMILIKQEWWLNDNDDDNDDDNDNGFCRIK